jgi:hypothetical protein
MVSELQSSCRDGTSSQALSGACTLDVRRAKETERGKSAREFVQIGNVVIAISLDANAFVPTSACRKSQLSGTRARKASCKAKKQTPRKIETTRQEGRAGVRVRAEAAQKRAPEGRSRPEPKSASVGTGTQKPAIASPAPKKGPQLGVRLMAALRRIAIAADFVR